MNLNNIVGITQSLGQIRRKRKKGDYKPDYTPLWGILTGLIILVLLIIFI